MENWAFCCGKNVEMFHCEYRRIRFWERQMFVELRETTCAATHETANNNESPHMHDETRIAG